jgi:hypothetical protein
VTFGMLNDRVAAAIERLHAHEEACVKAMLARWDPTWGRPVLVLSPPSLASLRPDALTMTLESRLRGLGSCEDGQDCVMRVTVDDVLSTSATTENNPYRR